MNALDVFKRYAGAAQQLRRIEEQIERRRTLAEGGASRPLSPAGGRASGDASMKLVDYVADMERLEAELNRRRDQRANDRACCVYLAGMLPERFGEALVCRYIDGLAPQACANRMGYSVQHFRRILRDAEVICSGMELTVWDGKHIPIIAMTY